MKKWRVVYEEHKTRILSQAPPVTGSYLHGLYTLKLGDGRL
ncbi:MAG: hypothetical protein V4568_16950 [Pseudomonadota bacterium]